MSNHNQTKLRLLTTTYKGFWGNYKIFQLTTNNRKPIWVNWKLLNFAVNELRTTTSDFRPTTKFRLIPYFRQISATTKYSKLQTHRSQPQSCSPNHIKSKANHKHVRVNYKHQKSEAKRKRLARNRNEHLTKFRQKQFQEPALGS